MKTVEILRARQTRILEAINSRPAQRGMGTEDFEQLVSMKAIRAGATSLRQVMAIVDATMVTR